MKVMQSETLWNEEIRRRCEVVDIAEKVREAKLRRYGHVIRRDEGEPVRDMEWRDKKMCGGRHRREGEGSKVEMVWSCNKKR